MSKKHKFQWYQELYEKTPKIVAEAKEIAIELGFDKYRDLIGLYPGSSACPGHLPEYVMDAIIEINKKPMYPLRIVEDEIRAVIKDVYGDEYDVAVANCAEAGLRASLEILVAPPTMRKGDAYRGRLITTYGEDYEYFGAYGRPFPPKYKNINVDRSVTAGELAVEAKSLNNLDSVFVRCVGAKYEVHGIKQNPISILTKVNAEKTAQQIRKVAERHVGNLTGFAMVGYDTPGWGNGEKDSGGVPVLMKMVGDIAEDFDVPFLVDCASCLPIIGVSPKDINADIMVWSMDKPGRAPISGLIVGKGEAMVPVRKGLGYGGQRYGEVSSHGKALYSAADPGRDALVGLLAFLKILKNNPDKVTRQIDKMHEIIVEEFNTLNPSRFREKILFTKSYSMGGTEVNYAHTWDDKDQFGIPLFGLEDLYANTNPIAIAQEAMGISPTTTYSGNMFLAPGLGTFDEHAELNEEYTRIGIKSLVKSVEIVCKYAGLMS